MLPGSGRSIQNLALAPVETGEFAAAGERCPHQAVAIDVDAARSVVQLAGELRIVERRFVDLRRAGRGRIRAGHGADDFPRHRAWSPHTKRCRPLDSPRSRSRSTGAPSGRVLDRPAHSGMVNAPGLAVAVVVNHRGAPALRFCSVVRLVPDARLEPAQAAQCARRSRASRPCHSRKPRGSARSTGRRPQISASWDRKYPSPIPEGFPRASACPCLQVTSMRESIWTGLPDSQALA